MKYKLSMYKDYLHLILYLLLAVTTPLLASVIIAQINQVAM